MVSDEPYKVLLALALNSQLIEPPPPPEALPDDVREDIVKAPSAK